MSHKSVMFNVSLIKDIIVTSTDVLVFGFIYFSHKGIEVVTKYNLDAIFIVCQYVFVAIFLAFSFHNLLDLYTFDVYGGTRDSKFPTESLEFTILINFAFVVDW